MRYLEQFPNYDDTLPTLEGFYDTSWHNDLCPAITNADNVSEDKVVTVFCDWKDINQREWQDPRFTVYFNNNYEDVIFQSENFEDIRAFIKSKSV